jgi:hypothetical protein
MKRRGVEQRLVILGASNDRKSTVDRTLLKAISRSRIWWEKLASGESASLLELAKAENNPRYIVRLLPLAFPAPDIA